MYASGPNAATTLSGRQAAHLFRSLRLSFTPLSHLHAPLLAGHVPAAVLAQLGVATNEEIYLLQQGIWHAAVRGLGVQGTLTDEDMAGLLDPFETAKSLLHSARSNLESLETFLDDVLEQSNAAHILERCLREPDTRTVWMVRRRPGHFPSEDQINQVLDEIRGAGRREAK